MRVLATVILFASSLLIFESDQVLDWVAPEWQPLVQGWHNLIQATGYDGLRSGLRQGFWQWLDDFLNEPSVETIDQTTVVQEPRFSASYPLSILVLGDSLAGFYLPNALTSLAQADGRVEVESFYRVAASLSNPSRMDFNREVPRYWEQRVQQRGRGFDVVVVLMGANDNQAIRLGGRWLRFLTQEWTREYTHRLTQLADFLNRRARMTYWLELPPMRDANLDRDLRLIETLIKEQLVQFPKIKFLPQRQLLSYQNQYTPVGILEGVQVPLRARDGIHLSSHGARILARDLWEKIFTDFEFEQAPRPTTSTDQNGNQSGSDSLRRN